MICSNTSSSVQYVDVTYTSSWGLEWDDGSDNPDATAGVREPRKPVCPRCGSSACLTPDPIINDGFGL